MKALITILMMSAATAGTAGPGTAAAPAATAPKAAVPVQKPPVQNPPVQTPVPNNQAPLPNNNGNGAPGMPGNAVPPMGTQNPASGNSTVNQNQYGQPPQGIHPGYGQVVQPGAQNVQPSVNQNVQPGLNQSVQQQFTRPGVTPQPGVNQQPYPAGGTYVPGGGYVPGGSTQPNAPPGANQPYGGSSGLNQQPMPTNALSGMHVNTNAFGGTPTMPANGAPYLNGRASGAAPNVPPGR